MDRETLTPWAFFNAGKPIRITNRRGDTTVSYENIELDNSPRAVFWNRFFIPCIEDIVVEQMEAAVKQCRETDWPDDEPLRETAELLRERTRHFLGRMASVDRTLRGKGNPDKVPLRGTDEEQQRISAIIDSHLVGREEFADP